MRHFLAVVLRWRSDFRFLLLLRLFVWSLRLYEFLKRLSSLRNLSIQYILKIKPIIIIESLSALLESF